MLCYKKKKETYTEPLTEQQFYRLLRSKQWNRNIDLYRETGKDSYKTSLPAICFQATFDKSKRAIKDKKTKKVIGYEEGCWNLQKYANLTGLVVLDIDHVDNPVGLINEKWRMETSRNSESHRACMFGRDVTRLGEANGKLVATEELVQNNHYSLSQIQSALERILFVFITPSAKGLKIVFKANMDWGNLADNQIEMAKLLGVEADESGKDASRIAFICKEEDVLFIDKQLFTYEDKDFAKKYNDQYRHGDSSPVKHSIDDFVNPGDNPVTPPQVDGQAPHEGGALVAGEMAEPVMWHGYDVQDIINQRFADKLPCESDHNRHESGLKLGSDLLALLDADRSKVKEILKAQSWIKEIMAARNEDVDKLVEDSAEYNRKQVKNHLRVYPSKEMQAAIEVVCGQPYRDILNNNSQLSIVSSQLSIEKQLWIWGKEIEALFPDFPLLKDATKGLKQNQFTAALFVAGSLLMTLMTRCTYRFYHRPEELRRLNSSVIIEGDPACGKSFATRLFKLLSKPIADADKEGKKAINAYRELMKTKGANKEKPNKPKVVVRIHPARTSNAQFIQDMVNSVEVVDGEEMQLHMLTFDTELDNTLSIQKGGSWIDKISLELKAFHNEEDGQAYSNVDSVMQDFIVTWNYIYTGTPLALKKKVNERNFGSGLATRLTCIPLPSTNFEMLTRESNVDYESDERLKEWAYKLDKTKGELSLQKIIDALFDWTERRMADAAYNDSKADEMLLKRCAYHGINFAAPFIVMRHWDQLKKDGDFWCGEFETDEIDWRLVELIVNIQYACQKHYFGAMAEKYFDDKTRDAAVSRQRQQKTVESYARLPEEFTVEDVMRCFDLKNHAAARVRASRLMKDGLAKKVSEVEVDGRQQAVYSKTGAIMIS